VSSAVLDASALLALLHREPGAEVVERRMAGACLSTVNYSEVLKKAVEKGGTLAAAGAAVRALQLAIIPFDERQAAEAAGLYSRTRDKGLSFADRACLSLAIRSGSTVLTGDGRWAELDLPVAVVVIREGGAKHEHKKR
jgi:PIN domain nuclease of toxin-antitoxin system